MASLRSSPVNRLARAAHLASGRLHRARILPNFLIVGAQRAGTTSMYRALGQHRSCSEL
jgi:hypothetical protein